MDSRKPRLKQEEKPVSKLADKFDSWMTHYNHNGSGHNEDNNKALVDWLTNDSGAVYVRDYEHFCELAKLVHAKGYATNPPPSESDFNKGVAKYQSYKSQKDMWRPTMYQPRGRGGIVQSASTVAFLDMIEGYQRPGGARDIYESDLIKIEDLFKPNFKK